MKSNKNEEYRKELNKITADKKLKERILSQAGKENVNTRKFRYVQPLVLITIIVIFVFVIKSADINKSLNPSKNFNTDRISSSNTSLVQQPNESSVVVTTINETQSNNETTQNEDKDIDSKVNMNVILSGIYGEEDFSIEFEYYNELNSEVSTGRSFYIEIEELDGGCITLTIYNPEQPIVFEEDAWIIMPEQIRLENMTKYFMKGYPELIKNITDGTMGDKKVYVCNTVHYNDGENSKEINVRAKIN